MTDTAKTHGIAPAGFRLPAETTVGAVHLLVSDLGRSVEYYETVLGLRVASRTATTATLTAQPDERQIVVKPDERQIVVKPDERQIVVKNDERPLVQLEARPGVRPLSGPALGLYHFAILVPDRPSLGRFLGHLSALGARAGMSDHLVSEAIYLTDPDGLGIEVYADRPRAGWRYTGRQIEMTTMPLDARSLLAAGAHEPWTGMPAGTVIGHVHLHVADLQAAEAFYHLALGFDKVVWDYPGALFLSAGGYHHHLGTNTWSPGPPPSSDHARLLSWDIVLPGGDDARAAASSLAAAGYAVEQAGDAWTAVDPWGTPLRLVVRNDMHTIPAH